MAPVLALAHGADARSSGRPLEDGGASPRLQARMARHVMARQHLHVGGLVHAHEAAGWRTVAHPGWRSDRVYKRPNIKRSEVFRATFQMLHPHPAAHTTRPVFHPSAMPFCGLPRLPGGSLGRWRPHEGRGCDVGAHCHGFFNTHCMQRKGGAPPRRRRRRELDVNFGTRRPCPSPTTGKAGHCKQPQLPLLAQPIWFSRSLHISATQKKKRPHVPISSI